VATVPTITVLLSVHNGLPYLEAAVHSILAQSFRDFEFLIVDDASTDGTGDYLRTLTDARIRLIPLTENIGLTAALNLGLREARGEFVARQDADDWSHPRRLELQAAFLRANARCGAVGSQARLINGSDGSLGKKDFPRAHHGICFAHLFDNALAHAAVTFRRAVVQDIGGYDEAWAASQDYELWSRLSVSQELANLPQRLATLRVLDSSITRQHRRPELIRRVQAAHYERLFGRAPSEADLDLIALFRSRVVPERLREFRALLHELVAAYAEKHPGIGQETDFRRTLSMIHERVGYNLLSLSRRAGFGELLRAIRARPAAIFSLPWLRIGALTVLGDSARRLYQRAAK
jgi:glycosyltransferase involved in cell wall biosynthesis